VLKDAREERGSWWPFWSEWLARHAGARARTERAR